MQAVVDQIQGDKAVLLLGNEEIPLVLPLKYLPRGVEESTILQLAFAIDQKKTERTLGAMAARIARLKEKSR